MFTCSYSDSPKQRAETIMIIRRAITTPYVHYLSAHDTRIDAKDRIRTIQEAPFFDVPTQEGLYRSRFREV